MESHFKGLPLDIYSMSKSPEESSRDFVAYEILFILDGKVSFTVLSVAREFEKTMDEFVKNLGRKD